LSLIARVVAVNDTYSIIDAGSKALSSDLGPHGVGGSGYGAVIDAGGEPATGMFRVERMSEEHGFVAHNGAPLPLGRLVRVFPNHACATVAQFDEFTYKAPDGSVRPSRIHARGCLT
jgi:D-serine deaminase-like pyridoxal phosphate-dependent protein